MEADQVTTPSKPDGALQPQRVDQAADYKPKNQLSALLHLGLGVMLLSGLFTLSRYNFLLFHGIVELFSIAVAWSTFLLIWNVRREMHNDALLFLGIAYFFVGSLDLVHTLVYKGTGIVALDLAANYASQLWIAARSLEAVCLFLFPFLLTRRIQLWLVVFCLTSVTGLIFAAIFVWHLFPICYIEGTGLTLFKKAAEYAICLTLTAAMVFIVRRRKHLDAEVFQLMMWAMALTIAGELAFTFYVSVYGVSNVVGHFFKIISFFFIYLALIRSSLARPYATLFRQLEQEKQEHRQNRELLGAVFATTPDLFALKDRQLKFQFTNPAFCHFLGRTQEEIVGKSDNDLFPHEEAEVYQQGDRKVITSGHQESGDFLITGKSGKRWLHVTKTPVRNAEGTITGLLSSVSDISARKRDETIMAARLNLLRTAESHSLAELLQATLAECESITGSQVGFYHFLDADQTTLSLQAWSTNTLATMCTAEGSGLHYPVSQAGVWVDCIKKRTPVIHNDYASLPHRKGFPQGHAPIIRELVVPVMRGEVIVAILGVGNKPTNYDDRDVEAVNFLADLAWDIAERKRAEEALRASENKFKTLTEASPSGIWQTDAKGNNTYVSTRWLEITGIKPAEALGAGWAQGVHADDRDEVTRLWLQAAQTAEAGYESEFRFVRPDGEIIWVLCIARRVKDPANSETVNWVGIITDITERKRTEARLQESLQRYEMVLEGATGGIWDWDIPNKKVHFSSRWKAMRGYTDEEISDSESEWSNNLHPDDKQAVLAGVAALFASETNVFEMAYRVCCKDGSWKWVEDRGKAIRDSTGKVIRMAGSEVDISERKQAEDALKLVAESSLLSAQDIFPFLVRQIAISQGMRYAFIARVDHSASTAHTAAVWCGDRYGENFSYALEGTPCHTVVSGGDCFYPSNVQALFPHDQLLVDMGIESYWGTALRTSTGELLGVMAIMHDQPIIETPQTHALLQAFALRTSVEMERQQTEKLLRENQEDLKEAQHVAKLGNWRLNIKNNQVVWSDELYKMYGFDPTLPPPPYTEHMKLFTPESWERLSTALQHTRDTGIPYDLELETLRIDGSRGWMWVFGMAEVDATKKAIGLRGVAQDITGRKLAEEELRELEERFRLTFHTSPDAVNINRMDGTYFEINEGFTDLTGFTRKDVIGKTSADINIWDIPEDRERLVEGLQREGYVRNLESRFLMKDGSCKIALMSAVIIQLKGEPHILSITRDITSFKKAEEDKLILQRQLQQSQKMEAVGQLAGGVAHDFNNMLGVIIGYSELILEQVDPTQQFHAELEEIQKAARRSADLTRQLLTFARKQTVAPQVLDLNQTIEGMLNMLRRLIGENINLAWFPETGLWQVRMDPSQIDQILANLSVNARDAIAGVGKITVETENTTFDEEYCASHAGSLPGEYVRIAVSDTGSGMDKETLAHIFEPFFTTKGIGEGTGLGLASVYGAVKQNNGFINAYSEPGQGTTFTIYIPRHVETTAEPQLTASTQPVVRGNEIVMLVEDELTLLQMSKIMLERLGYTVLTAGAPSEAIRLADEYPGRIHLLATDVIMPEMNGRELSARLLRSRPEMKCLFMSGYTANIIANQGVLKKGVPFIQKPFSKNELAIKVREAMES